ncbi:MAG: CaiB/BaiF CoA transferase family protein [Acidimicrobiales bacterium]
MKRRPLEGIRVADLSMMWAGPVATKLLGDLGAEVLKIESPSAWDNIRTLITQPGVPEPWNSSYYFNTYNRSKKSVTLDLAQAKGREIFLDLLQHCDVLLENYRADVLDTLQLPYDVLRAANPNLVVVSMAGFGKTGADRALVGFGPVIEMMSGLTSLTGYQRPGGTDAGADTGPESDAVPYKCGVSYGDPVAGVAAAGAVMLGLLQRHRGGPAPIIDLAQREVAATLAGSAFVAAHRQPQPTLHGNRDPHGVAIRGAYRCQDELRQYKPSTTLPAQPIDEQWIALSVLDNNQWVSLCGLLERPDWTDLEQSSRQARHDEIDAVIAAWAAPQPAAEAVAVLQDRGIAASRVLDMVAVLDDPHLRARGFWTELPHPRMPDRWRQPGPSWRLLGVDTAPRQPAPTFGEHTRQVLGDLLGLDTAALDALAAANIIADAPINPGVG